LCSKLINTSDIAGVGFVDSVKLQSAREGSGGTPATNIEQCSCPDGYVGQFCESCAPGYRRDPPGGGSLAQCIPCNCNKHSDACDVTTGQDFKLVLCIYLFNEVGGDLVISVLCPCYEMYSMNFNFEILLCFAICKM